MGNIVMNNLPYPAVSGQLLITKNSFIENPAIDDMEWKNVNDLIGVADIQSIIDEEGNVIIQSFEYGEWVDKIKLAGQIDLEEINKLKSINYVDYKFIFNSENKTITIRGGKYENETIVYYDLLTFPVSGVEYIEGDGIQITNITDEIKKIAIKTNSGIRFNTNGEIELNVDEIFTFINGKLFLNAGNGINENNNQINISTNFNEDINPLDNGESFIKLYNDNKIGIDDNKLQHKLKAGANITIEQDPTDPTKDIISATGVLSIKTENPLYTDNTEPDNPKLALRYDNNSLKLTANKNLYVDKDAIIDNNTIDLNSTTREMQVQPQNIIVPSSNNLIEVVKVEDPTGKSPEYKLHTFKDNYIYNFSNDFEKTKADGQPYNVKLLKDNLISAPLKIEGDKITLDIENKGLEIEGEKLNIKIDNDTIQINERNELEINNNFRLENDPVIILENQYEYDNYVEKEEHFIIDENFKKTYKNRILIYEISNNCTVTTATGKNVTDLSGLNYYLNGTKFRFKLDRFYFETSGNLINSHFNFFNINELPLGNYSLFAVVGSYTNKTTNTSTFKLYVL